MREILKFSEDLQKKIYAKFHGPIQFDLQAEKQFGAIKPWVENWIEVQIISIVQREVLAKNRAAIEVCAVKHNLCCAARITVVQAKMTIMITTTFLVLKDILNENKQRMVSAFKELLQSNLIEATIKIETLIKELTQEMEFVETSKSPL